ncbi:MAG: transglycosylase SLT domain-containing protein [Paludibacter sp.]|nr:transglycosylase SLT domain-containing protein [Paludibacter sp.]
MNIPKIIFYILFIFKIIIINDLSAQNKNIFRKTNTTDTTVQIKVSPPDITDQPADASELKSFEEKMQKWARLRGKYDAECKRKSTDPNVVPDSIYKQRLASLPYIMETPYNEIVRSYIDSYTIRHRQSTEYMLGSSKYYFPIIEEILERKGLPLELKYLPVIESAFNPTAVSSAKAVGLWQFIAQTAQSYNLEINSLVDERLDPIKSTYAAADYLSDLYEMFGDWHLAIAAYNCGPANVRKAISRSGGKTDYWAIYPYLPRETRGYVPIFIAANYTFEFAAEHNLCAMVPELPALTDTILIYERIHFQQISSVINIPYDELKNINPQYRQDIIPGSQLKAYPLRLPINYIDMFLTRYDSIVAYKADELINRRDEVEAQTAAEYYKGTIRYHTVRKGQTISSIAARYGVSVNNLKKWNNISGSKVSVGKKLKIKK